MNDEYRMTNFYDTIEPWEKDWPDDELDAEESCVIREDAAGSRDGYDLEERTAKFGEAVIDFLKKIPRGPHTYRLIDQLTGCGTSIGGNYCEADDAVSRKEFVLKINTCRKEAREAKFFIRMLARAVPDLKPEARILWEEARALHLIFSRIRRTTLERK